VTAIRRNHANTSNHLEESLKRNDSDVKVSEEAVVVFLFKGDARGDGRRVYQRVIQLPRGLNIFQIKCSLSLVRVLSKQLNAFGLAEVLRKTLRD
jgi:hypothetical protein